MSSENDYLDELNANTQSQDLIKADILIDHYNDLNSQTKQQVLDVLINEDDEYCLLFLVKLYKHTESAAEIYEAIHLKIFRNPSIFLELLADPGNHNRDFFIDAATDIKLWEAVPELLDILNHTSDPVQIKHILSSIGKIGNPDAINSIVEYLYSEDRDLIFTAIEALKDIAEPEAVQYLAKRMGTDKEFDLRIIEAFEIIKDQAAIEQLNKLLNSHNAYIRNHAKTRLLRIGPKSVPILIDNLKDEDTDFLIHTLNVLGEIGDISAAQPIRNFLFHEPENSNIRFAAYEALGMLPLEKGAYILAEGLADKEEQVRVAAAKAIEKNLNDMLLAGIKNLTRQETEESQNVVAAIINAESFKIFTSCLNEDSFEKMAIEYLNLKAHPDLKKLFDMILRRSGYSNTADKLVAATDKKEKEEKIKIYAVDDSRMILKVYKANLFKIGHEAEFFEFPETALKEIEKNKPDIVFTDLNMPKMNGVELTKRIRDLYSKEELPVVMVTTQTDLEDKEAAYEAGVNVLLPKPFSPEQLKTEIEKVKS